MNYILFRIIIFVLLILLIQILFNYVNHGKIKNIIYIITIIALFISICIYPIENNLLKFKSIDKAFKYYYPTAKILNKYDYEEYAYIVYKDIKYDSPGLMYLIKENGTWKINNLLTKGNAKSKIYTGCFISIIKLPKMNSTGIIVHHSVIKKLEDGKISDSLSSDFETYISNENKDTQHNTDIVILNDKIDENYTIYLDGREYRPFKK